MSQYPLDLVFLAVLLAGMCVALGVANLKLGDKLATRDDALGWIEAHGNLCPAARAHVRNMLKGEE